MTKRAQFFLIAFVFILLAFFVLFTYFQTIDKSSVVMSEQSSLLDMENLANSFRTRNLWLSGYWWNTSWSNRTLVNITAGATNPVEVQAGIVGECNRTVRVINSTGTEIASNVSAASSPCNVTFNADVGKYYIYWNNPDALLPSYRNGELNYTSNFPTYTLSLEAIPHTQLCTHLEMVYPKLGLALDCSSLLGT